MKVATYEGIVEGGSVRLPDEVRLPDNTKVYIVVPSLESGLAVHICSPRLVHPDQAKDFKMEVVEEGGDAGL